MKSAQLMHDIFRKTVWLWFKATKKLSSSANSRKNPHILVCGLGLKYSFALRWNGFASNKKLFPLESVPGSAADFLVIFWETFPPEKQILANKSTPRLFKIDRPWALLQAKGTKGEIRIRFWSTPKTHARLSRYCRLSIFSCRMQGV